MFSDLKAMYAAAKVTPNVQRYVKREYVRLLKAEKTAEVEAKIAAMQQDQDTFVFAMRIDDSVWNIDQEKDWSGNLLSTQALPQGNNNLILNNLTRSQKTEEKLPMPIDFILKPSRK